MLTKLFQHREVLVSFTYPCFSYSFKCFHIYLFLYLCMNFCICLFISVLIYLFIHLSVYMLSRILFIDDVTACLQKLEAVMDEDSLNIANCEGACCCSSSWECVRGPHSPGVGEEGVVKDLTLKEFIVLLELVFIFEFVYFEDYLAIDIYCRS